MKFKVGDKVTLIKKTGAIVSGAGIGCELTILEVGNYIGGLQYLVSYIDDFGKSVINGKVADCHIELIESKPTKNQRITALEKEIAELKVIVHQLREANITIEDVKRHLNITSPAKVFEPLPSTDDVVEDKPKTANELRGEIIEKAKMFIENTKLANHYQVSDGPFGSFICDVEFVVNEQKRTVVALMRSTNNKSIKSKGIAKCNPSDVFNSHIGKAIALGRALNLDVSEFEKAVQPTGVVVGMVCKIKDQLHPYEAKIIDDSYYNNSVRHHVSYAKKYLIQILNDTNAIYGGGE